MRFVADITIIADTQRGFTPEQIREGIEARLHPVAACYPDDVVSETVTVRRVDFPRFEDLRQELVKELEDEMQRTIENSGEPLSREDFISDIARRFATMAGWA